MRCRQKKRKKKKKKEEIRHCLVYSMCLSENLVVASLCFVWKLQTIDFYVHNTINCLMNTCDKLVMFLLQVFILKEH